MKVKPSRQRGGTTLWANIEPFQCAEQRGRVLRAG